MFYGHDDTDDEAKKSVGKLLLLVLPRAVWCVVCCVGVGVDVRGRRRRWVEAGWMMLMMLLLYCLQAPAFPRRSHPATELRTCLSPGLCSVRGGARGWVRPWVG